MKTIKDLTQKQALELVTILHGDKWLRTDLSFNARYVPENPDFYEDGYEHYRIDFKGVTFGDTIDKMTLFIYPNLDMAKYYVRDRMISLPIHNQHKLHKKFIEWEIEEKEFLKESES
jgi:hypothetical protein